MTDPERLPDTAVAIDPDAPMTDELCLFVISLTRDGRRLPAQLVARAEAWASEHPSCQQALADFAALGDVLANEPPRRASEGFTESVLTGQRRVDRGGNVLPLLRRMSVAAAVLLGLTLAFDMTFPAGAAADDELARQAHAIDAIRPDPFSPADLDAGLRALLPDATPLSGGARPAAGTRADR